MTGTLLVLGLGYSARALARQLLSDGWTVFGTTRSRDREDEIAATGVQPLLWPGSDILPALVASDHLLASAAPDADGDPFLADLGQEIAAARHLRWVGYLSTTGVYGDRGGDWVDEDDPLCPSTTRGRQRVLAEEQWRATGLPLHVFRLAGIYGPGRGPFAKVRAGTARRIVKLGQVFSRIHVDDIAQVLAASIARPDPGRAYNVCDDDPAPPQDVIAEAARLLDLPVPPAEPLESADLGPMARSFYAESKKVRNDRIKDELGVRLIHRDYRAGLRALLEHERARQ